VTNQLPAYLRQNDAQIPDFTDRLSANLGSAPPPYLSIQGGRLTLIDSTGATEPVTTVDPKTGIVYLDACIIDAGDHPSKIFFGQAFDPNAQNYSPPKCWSDNGVGPSTACAEPQAPSCAPDPTGVSGCKLAVWGSATSKVTGKGIPACGKYYKLALLVPGDDIQFLLRVPPASLDNLQSYLSKFKGQAIRLKDCITRISFEPQGIGILTFVGVGLIDEATAKQRDEVLLAKKTDGLIGRGDLPRLGGQAALPNLVGSAPASLSAPFASSPVSAPVAAPAGRQEFERPLTSAPIAAAPVLAATEPVTTQSAVPVVVAGASPSAKRRGRPPKTDAAPAPAGEPVAPFRQPAGAGTQAAQFGMVEAPAPHAELEATLKSMFG
jgi:hypothetical protein